MQPPSRLDKDKNAAVSIAAELEDLGIKIFATRGTAKHFNDNNIACTVIKKIQEGSPNVVDLLRNKEISLLINSPVDKNSKLDDTYIRKEALLQKVPYTTTIPAARAVVSAIRSIQNSELGVTSIQEYHKTVQQ